MLAAYLFLAPGFLLFTLVILYPIGRALQISLHEWAIAPGLASEFVGLQNYRHAIDDPIFWRALVNTGFYMAATVPAQIVIGLAAAVLLDARMPARTFFRTLLLRARDHELGRRLPALPVPLHHRRGPRQLDARPTAFT